MRGTALRLLTAATLLLFPAACGEDDGASVRNIGGTGSASGSGTGHGSGSGTGHGSGSATGHATGSGSATAPPECEEVGTSATADASVRVTLDEWSVTPADRRVPAGAIAFAARNAGAEAHELMIVRGEADDLPVDEDGAVDVEALPDGAVIGEIEPFPAGQTCEGTFELDRPGTYSLLCNIVEKHGDETVAHFAEGMRAQITVRR